MSSTQTQSGKGKQGAKRASWSPDNPRAAADKVFETLGIDADENDQENEFFALVDPHPGVRRQLANYFLAHAREARKRSNRGPSNGGHARREESKAETRALAKKIVAKVETEIERRVHYTVATIMPTGKSLGDTTREELIALGSWQAALAAKMRPGQTVTQARLTEADINAAFKLTPSPQKVA